MYYPYLIIGGGMTANAAITGIRRHDKDGLIGIFSTERYPAYNRPPLSKKLWLDERVEDIWLRVPTPIGVEEHLGTSIVAINPDSHTVKDQWGNLWDYDKLLLATGGSPRKLAGPDAGVRYYRTLEDYFSLYKALKPGSQVLCIGGGFIASELAAVLATRGHQVTMMFPEEHLLGERFPRDLSKYIEQTYREHHVQLVGHETADSVSRKGRGFMVVTGDGKTLTADVVLAGIGLRPNVDLADLAGLAVDNGILVDQELRTSAPDVWAAGDVASFQLSFMASRLRVEHEDNALMQGRTAGENMAGAAKAYTHLPFFYSDMFAFGYEAIGTIDSRLNVYSDWTTFGEEGVLYYLNDDKVVGVVNWNVWDRIPAARELITSRTRVSNPKELKRRITSA